MEALKVKQPTKVTWSYDEEADTLYISFGPPRAALTLDLGEGVLARYVEEEGLLVGVTIVGLRQREPKGSASTRTPSGTA